MDILATTLDMFEADSAEEKADRINRVFAEHGTAGPAKIKPGTVEHGQRKGRRSGP
jgi:hypothetical protein